LYCKANIAIYCSPLVRRLETTPASSSYHDDDESTRGRRVKYRAESLWQYTSMIYAATSCVCDGCGSDWRGAKRAISLPCNYALTLVFYRTILPAILTSNELSLKKNGCSSPTLCINLHLLFPVYLNDVERLFHTKAAVQGSYLDGFSDLDRVAVILTMEYHRRPSLSRE
jgi:hypothetical protein